MLGRKKRWELSKAWAKMCRGMISWIFAAKNPKNSPLWQNKVNYVKGKHFILAHIHSFISMCEWNGGEKQRQRASGWSEFIHNYRQWRLLRGCVIGFLSISRSHGALTCPGSTRLDAAAESECECVSWHNREVTNTQRNVNGKHPISNWPIAHCKYRPIHDYAVTVSPQKNMLCAQ